LSGNGVLLRRDRRREVLFSSSFWSLCLWGLESLSPEKKREKEEKRLSSGESSVFKVKS